MKKQLIDMLQRHLSAQEPHSNAEESQGEERETGLSRRALLRNLGITGGTIASAALLPRLVGAQPPSTPQADGNAAGNAAGGSGSGYNGSGDAAMGAHRMGANMPRTVGEVDHKANGFNPSDILTDFDYGKVSRLPNGQTLREWELVGQDKDIEVAPGVMFPAWTFNGRVPGPTLRATEGDRMRVHFRNESAMAHTIHFHGIHPYPMDGVPGAGPGPISPGGSFTYEFDAEPFGCHLYHCHTFP